MFDFILQAFHHLFKSVELSYQIAIFLIILFIVLILIRIRLHDIYNWRMRRSYLNLASTYLFWHRLYRDIIIFLKLFFLAFVDILFPLLNKLFIWYRKNLFIFLHFYHILYLIFVVYNNIRFFVMFKILLYWFLNHHILGIDAIIPLFHP